MTKKTDAKKAELLEALKKRLGIVTFACEDVGLHKDTYYEWLKKDADFAREVEVLNDYQGDFVKYQLLKRIREGDTTAIIFYCKTKLKHQGFVERIETTGKDGGAIETKVNIVATKTDHEILEEFKNRLIKTNGAALPKMPKSDDNPPIITVN